VAGAELGGKIYVAGGLTTLTDALAAFEVYDPATDTWTKLPDLPEPRHHAGLAALDGKLYLTGGYPAGGWPWTPSDRVFRYDPETGEWEEATPMRRPRAAHTSAVVDGKLYVIGGVTIDVTDVDATVEVYDPATDRWEARAPMPTAREHLASAVIDGRIYVVGGRRVNFNFATLEVYSPETDSWATLPAMPTPRGGIAAAALRGKLYVFGGELLGGSTFKATEEFDPSTSTWLQMADMPTGRHGIAAAAVGDWIYVIAGGLVAGASHSTTNEAFRP